MRQRADKRERQKYRQKVLLESDKTLKCILGYVEATGKRARVFQNIKGSVERYKTSDCVFDACMRSKG
tara:strand:- start:134 stop:337 length:204 start_codon:yes stop_codon:yes gene_type:complete